MKLNSISGNSELLRHPELAEGTIVYRTCKEFIANSLKIPLYVPISFFGVARNDQIN